MFRWFFHHVLVICWVPRDCWSTKLSFILFGNWLATSAASRVSWACQAVMAIFPEYSRNTNIWVWWPAWIQTIENIDPISWQEEIKRWVTIDTGAERSRGRVHFPINIPKEQPNCHWHREEKRPLSVDHRLKVKTCLLECRDHFIRKE